MDREYYADNDDGTEPHGYWIKTADYERKQAQMREAKQAVIEGRACWLRDNPNLLPF
jgi:hypothetical protein